MKEKLENLFALFKEKKTYFFLGLLFVFFLLGFFLTTLTIKRVQPQPSPQPPTPFQKEAEFQKPILKPETPKKTQVLPPPEVFFENYENKADLPQAPPNLKTYTFKSFFPLAEILSLGQKLGLTEIKFNDDYVIVYNAIDRKKAGLMLFNRRNGAFSFQSYGLHQTANNNQKVLLAQGFLNDLGLIDETVSCELTYQKKDSPGVTFVECHRNWNLVGLPILNFFGVLNLPEEKSLAELKIGEEVEGEKRADDFNTITVGVTNDNQIYSIDSSLRPIADAETISLDELFTPQQALEQFIAHQAAFSLTIPAGKGTVDFERVYPGNLASAEKATITDYLLTFIELPYSLSTEGLFPMYLIRGTALLASGYNVRFTEVVPALKSGQSPISLKNNLGQVAAAEDSLKLGTFTPPPSPSPSVTPTPLPLAPSPTQGLPTITTVYPPGFTPFPTIPPDVLCKPSEADLNPIYDLGGLGKIGYYSDRRVGFYYYIKPASQPLPTLLDILAEFDKLSLTEGITQLRPTSELYDDWNRRMVCPLRLTGGSPTIFVYSKPETKLSIKTSRNLTYADPYVLKNNQWSVTIKENNTLNVNGLSRSFIYYEYEPIKFNQPDQGWILKKEELENFVKNTLSPVLGLTTFEKERLLFEFHHASFDINNENIFVGLINQEEIDEKLPLIISPKPDSIIRFHFYLQEASNPMTPIPPKLSSLKRSNFMVLELGAVKGK